MQVVIEPTQYAFGPGSLEGLILERRGIRLDDGRPQVQARISGTFRVYCGEGWEHVQPLNTDWIPANDLGPFSDADTSLWREREAHALVEVALSDWSDPCSTED